MGEVGLFSHGLYIGSMDFDSVKIIFISKKLELLTLKKSLAFSGRFSPFISSRIALTTRCLKELYRQRSLSLGNHAFCSNSSVRNQVFSRFKYNLY